MKKFLVLFLLCYLVSCKYHKVKRIKLHTYNCQKLVDNGKGNLTLFPYYLYVILGDDNSYYYYTSPTEVKNFSTVNFTNVKTLPKELEEEELMESIAEMDLEVFSSAIQEEENIDVDEIDIADPAESDPGDSGTDSGSDGGDGGDGSD